MVYCLLLCIPSSFTHAGAYRLAVEEKKAIENRQRITRYALEIDCQSFDPYNKNFSKTVGRAFYFDGKNTRNDTRIKRDVQIRGEEDSYNHINVWTIDKLIDYTQGVLEDGKQSGVSIRSLDLAYKEGTIPKDPRSIGMNPSGFMFREPIETFVACLERDNCISSDEELRGIPCKKFEYTHSRLGTVVKYWIAPSHGYSVIRIESFHDGVPRTFPQEPNDPMTDCTDLDVLEYKNTGLWFPISMKFTRTNEKTKKIELSENYSIRIISLNDAIGSDVFTMKGMNIPVGTYVMQLPESIEDNYFWDGHEIKGERGSVFSTPDKNRYTLLRTILILAGLGLICAACISKYQQIRQSQESR